MYILRVLSRLQPLREPDTGGGQGGQQPPAPAPGDPGGAGAGDRQQLQGLLARHQGDAMAVIATLLAENHGLRDERRTLRGQLPAQGAAVLTPEQATAWQAYQQLGTIEQLTQQGQAAQTTAGELKTLKRDLELRDVAAAADYQLDVLRTLAGDLAFVVKDEQQDGKPVKTVAVKDGDKEIPLDDYAKARWAAFLPALRPAAQQRPAIGTPRQAAPPRTPAGQGATQTEQPRKSVVRL